MSARVPLWLKLLKVDTSKLERPAIVKKIFEWAAKGLDQYLICDKLLAPILPHGDRFTKASLRGGRIAMSLPFSVPEVSLGNTSPT